jgi:hypothetical protein
MNRLKKIMVRDGDWRLVQYRSPDSGRTDPALLQASEQSRQNADWRPRFSRSASHMPAQPRCRR